MKFFCQMYLRRLMPHKIMWGILKELLEKEAVPDEHIVECICEVLMSTGYTLHSSPSGEQTLTQVCCRFEQWVQQKKFTKRIQFVIQDVLDIRDRNWERKAVNTLQAKTIAEIHSDFERERSLRSQG